MKRTIIAKIMKYRKGLEFEITVAISEGLDFLCKRFSHSSKNIELLVFASCHVVVLQQTLFVVKMTFSTFLRHSN